MLALKWANAVEATGTNSVTCLVPHQVQAIQLV